MKKAKNNVFKKEDDFKKHARPVFNGLLNYLARAVDGDLADKVTKTPWLVFGDAEMSDNFANLAAIKKEVDKTLSVYKNHFDLKIRETEESLKVCATTKQINDVTNWVQEIENTIHDNVRPVMERQSKTLVTLKDDISKASTTKKPSGASPFTAIQFQLAASVAAGPETAIADIREMLFTASALSLAKPERKNNIDKQIRKLQTLGGSRMTRPAMWDIISPIVTNEQAAELYTQITSLVNDSDDERNREASFKFKTYNFAAKSRLTHAEVVERKQASSGDREKRRKDKPTKKIVRRTGVMDSKQLQARTEETLRRHETHSDDEEAHTSRKASAWPERRRNINAKLAKSGHSGFKRARVDSEDELQDADLQIDTDQAMSEEQSHSDSD